MKGASVIKIIVLILFAFWLGYQIDKHKTKEPNPEQDPVIEYQNNIPPLDPNRDPLYFNYEEGKWVYKDEIKYRNNPSVFIIETPNIRNIDREEVEEIIQKYLEHNVDGYKEDTYWGEEYEFNDKNPKEESYWGEEK
jgi:hypothetical protein